MTAQEYATSLVNGKEFNEFHQLESVVADIRKKYDVKCEICYAGSFNSPGMDSEYYALVVVEDGTLSSLPVQIDTY